MNIENVKMIDADYDESSFSAAISKSKLFKYNELLSEDKEHLAFWVRVSQMAEKTGHIAEFVTTFILRVNAGEYAATKDDFEKHLKFTYMYGSFCHAYYMDEFLDVFTKNPDFERLALYFVDDQIWYTIMKLALRFIYSNFKHNPDGFEFDLDLFERFIDWAENGLQQTAKRLDSIPKPFVLLNPNSTYMLLLRIAKILFAVAYGAVMNLRGRGKHVRNTIYGNVATLLETYYIENDVEFSVFEPYCTDFRNFVASGGTNCDTRYAFIRGKLPKRVPVFSEVYNVEDLSYPLECTFFDMEEKEFFDKMYKKSKKKPHLMRFLISYVCDNIYKYSEPETITGEGKIRFCFVLKDFCEYLRSIKQFGIFCHILYIPDFLAGEPADGEYDIVKTVDDSVLLRIARYASVCFMNADKLASANPEYIYTRYIADPGNETESRIHTIDQMTKIVQDKDAVKSFISEVSISIIGLLQTAYRKKENPGYRTAYDEDLSLLMENVYADYIESEPVFFSTFEKFRSWWR